MLVTDYDFEQCKLLMEEVLQFLRSRNTSYGTANFVLEGAQKLLQQVVRKELADLPLAEGITFNFNGNDLMTASKRLIADAVQTHNISNELPQDNDTAPHMTHKSTFHISDADCIKIKNEVQNILDILKQPIWRTRMSVEQLDGLHDMRVKTLSVLTVFDEKYY